MIRRPTIIWYGDLLPSETQEIVATTTIVAGPPTVLLTVPASPPLCARRTVLMHVHAPLSIALAYPNIAQDLSKRLAQIIGSITHVFRGKATIAGNVDAQGRM